MTNKGGYQKTLQGIRQGSDGFLAPIVFSNKGMCINNTYVHSIMLKVMQLVRNSGYMRSSGNL